MVPTQPIVPFTPAAQANAEVEEAVQQAETPAMGTALVKAEPEASDRSALPQPQRPSAPFLAHLIATKRDFPQTRERRRAEPREATAAYENMLERIHRFP